MKKTVLIILSVFLPLLANTALAQHSDGSYFDQVFYADSIYYQIRCYNNRIYEEYVQVVDRNIVNAFVAKYPDKVDFPSFDVGFCKGALVVPDSVVFKNEKRWIDAITLEDLKNPSVKINEGRILSMRRGKFSKLELSPKVNTINAGAFDGCRNLTRMEVSRYLKKHTGFELNTSIQQFVVDKMNENLKDIDGVLFNRRGVALQKVPMAKCETYVVPEGTMYINDRAFSCDSDPATDNSRLKTLVLSESLVGVGKEAFKNNRTLREIYSKTAQPPAWVLNSSKIYVDGQFDGFDNISKCTLYVPKGCKQYYEQDKNWGKFSKIVETSEEPTVPPSTSHQLYNPLNLTGSYRPFVYKDSIYYKVDWDNDQAYVIDEDLVNQDIHVDPYTPFHPSFPSVAYNQTCKGDAIIVDNVEFEGITFPVVEVQSLKTLNCNSVRLSKNIKVVRDWAFDGGRFKHIDLGEGVKQIGWTAFNSCFNLTEIDIPSQVTDCHKAFYYGNYLKEIRVADDNPAYCSIDGVLFSKDKKVLYKFPRYHSENYVTPAETEIIGDYAFYTDYNGALKSLTLGENVHTLKTRVFKSINLSEIRCLSKVPPSTDALSFREFSTIGDCVLLVPEGCREVYAKHKEWGKFKNIQEIDSSDISLISADEKEFPIYDLQGRKLSNSKWSNGQIRKGIYIKDGRKFVVK